MDKFKTLENENRSLLAGKKKLKEELKMQELQILD